MRKNMGVVDSPFAVQFEARALAAFAARLVCYVCATLLELRVECIGVSLEDCADGM